MKPMGMACRVMLAAVVAVCGAAMAQEGERVSDELRAHSRAGDADVPAPRFKNASYGGESTLLENEYLKLVVHKRIGGWGWGELYTPDGKLMAVLEHLGEIMLRDQDIPMRLEAAELRREQTEDGEALIFEVASTVAQDKLAGSSFTEWMRYPFDEPAIVGEVRIELLRDEPLLRMQHRVRSTGNYFARYIRGPWLRAGQDSYGLDMTDAIFPGVEWLIEDEWSSGTDFFKDPWAMRWAPHPNKVTAPLMAVSHEGVGLGLAWQPTQTATRWFNYMEHRPQPVFACPNFIDRMSNTLMGVMVPDVAVENQENQVYAEPPLELHLDQRIEFDTEIWLSRGNSLDVMVDWVKRHGLPDPGAPRWPLEEALELIANAYNTNLWHEGKGFGIPQRNQISPNVPNFLVRYVEENAGSQLAEELREKIAWCREQSEPPRRDREPPTAVERGERILAEQQPNGSFLFEPDGRHYRKDDFVVARAFIEPMGLAGDTALDITILPAQDLIEIGRETGEQRFLDAARKALEFCMPMTRPEAGDFWETPLHAPNLLAAGHAAITYYMAYETFDDERYRDKAIYWIRSILPFTHLWTPQRLPMMYNTKPCLCSSDWYFANWVRDHVQWEVLAVFNESSDRGIWWHKIDPEIDWHRFHRGITTAAVRWLSQHERDDWRPHNLPDTLEAYRRGAFDFCYPDTHNSTTGNYGGMFIMPEAVARNIYGVLDAPE